MKTFFILLALVAAVWCEPCSVDSDCVITGCSDGSSNGVGCSNGQCTCLESTCNANENLGRCRNQQDCVNRYNFGQISCNCDMSDLHCIDGECHCGYPQTPQI